MRKMLSINEILTLIKKHDKDTAISKYTLRTMFVEKSVHCIKTGNHFCFDIDEVLAFFSPAIFENVPKQIPKLRHYEDTYHTLQKYAGSLALTWKDLHHLIDSGEVFSYKHGSRLIVNYEQILLQEHLK